MFPSRNFDLALALSIVVLPLAAGSVVTAFGRRSMAARAWRVARGSMGGLFAGTSGTLAAAVDPAVRAWLVGDGALVWALRAGGLVALTAGCWRARAEIRTALAARAGRDAGAGSPYRARPDAASIEPHVPRWVRVMAAFGAVSALATVAVAPFVAVDLGAIGPVAIRPNAAVALIAIGPGLDAGAARRELGSRSVPLTAALEEVLATCGRPEAPTQRCDPARLDAALAEMAAERSARARATLRHWLESGADPRARARAALELARLDAPRGAHELVAIVARNAGAPWARDDAREILAIVRENRPDEAVSVAAQLLRGFGPGSDVSGAALDLLVELGSVEALGAACALVNDPAWDEALGARLQRADSTHPERAQDPASAASRLRRRTPRGRRAACATALEARAALRANRWL